MMDCVSCFFCLLGYLFLIQVSRVEGGECCRTYVDGLGRYHSQKWCPIYCCGYTTLGGLKCCADPVLRAFEGHRDEFCAAWFIYSHNIWVPIIIALVVLAILIAACVCCIRCCFCVV